MSDFHPFEVVRRGRETQLQHVSLGEHLIKKDSLTILTPALF